MSTALRLTLFVFLACSLRKAHAQPAVTPAPPPIQDNSFLIEEAYNQERGVVQTIQTFTRQQGSSDWSYTFTQEWPVPAETHQLSFTLPVAAVENGETLSRGIGDLALNYRYQLIGSGSARLAVSPRLTLLVPTGDHRRGLGSGGVGLQVSLPASIVLSERFVTHSNVGGTYILSARNAGGFENDLRSWQLGQSLIWLVLPTFNAMVETLLTRVENLADTGGRRHQTDLVVSPGLRTALNLPGHLQIVGGVAVPFGVGPSHGQRGLFLYFSVELPVIRRPS